VHVLRRVHRALRPEGLLLDVHPLGEEFAVRAGTQGLGFVDTRDFRRVLGVMEDGVRRVLDEGLFVEVRAIRRHVVERLDSAAELLEEAETWEHLRLPAPLRRRLRSASESPVEMIDTVMYRLLRARGAG
jgi:hypothetical protein